MNPIKKLLPYLWIIALALSTTWLNAQNTGDTLKLTIDEARAFALTNNKTVMVSKMDVEIARKKVQEIVAIGLPQLNMNASYQHIFKVPEFGFGSAGFTEVPLSYTGPELQQWTRDDLGGINQYYAEGDKFPMMEKDNVSFDFAVTQIIFSGEYIVGLQASKVYQTMSEQNYKRSQLDIIQQVESTYYLILILKENLSIVESNKTLTEKTLTEMQAMLSAGFLEDTEVDQLRLNYTRLKNLESSLNGQVKNTLNLLKFQLGIDYTQPISIVDDIENVIVAFTPEYNTPFDINQNIEYQMVTNQVDISKLNLKREKSTMLPTIAGFYNHQELLKEPALNFQPKDIAGISLSLPIITSGSRLHKIKQASIEYDKSNIQRSQLNDGLQLKYQNLLLNYETAYNNFVNQKENSDISESIFGKTNIKFKEGISSSLDLTQTQIQYLTAISEYYNSVLQLINTRVEIERLLSNKL